MTCFSISEKQEKAINKNMKLNLTEHRFPFASGSLKPQCCPIMYRWKCLWEFRNEPVVFSTKENTAPIPRDFGFPGDAYRKSLTLARVSYFCLFCYCPFLSLFSFYDLTHSVLQGLPINHSSHYLLSAFYVPGPNLFTCSISRARISFCYGDK